MADENLTAEQLQHRVDAARRHYESLRDMFEQQLQQNFADAGDVADRLLSVADEFGKDQAVELLGERPDDYGVRVNGADGNWRDVASIYADDLEKLIEAHEQLDDLTRLRDNAAGRSERDLLRTLNIQGREYELDVLKRELREKESGERHRVDLPKDKTLTLTERAALGSKAEKAQPHPQRNRTRDR